MILQEQSKNGLLFVISGPSGVGKGTVVERVLKIEKNVVLSVSATTRSRRENELNGREYHFYSKNDFLNLAKQGKMLEFAEYCGNYYGTPKEPIEHWNSKGLNVLLEIEIEGAKQIKQKIKSSICIFILPPSKDILVSRLKNRGTETNTSIKGRIEKASEELKEAYKYDYLVVNDTIDLCAQDICSIMRAEELRLCNSKYLMKGFF